MSNAKRRRMQRQAGKRAAEDQLLEAVMAVGEAYGTKAACVEAACTLVQAGRLLGYELTIRPVSLVADDSATGHVVIMGEKATAELSDADRARAHDWVSTDLDATGHVIVTCEDPPWLFDPNLRQLGNYGIEAPSALIRIQSVHPGGGEWSFRHGGLHVRYILDEGSRWLLDNYAKVESAFEQDAIDIATFVRAGGTADDLLAARDGG